MRPRRRSQAGQRVQRAVMLLHGGRCVARRCVKQRWAARRSLCSAAAAPPPLDERPSVIVAGGGAAGLTAAFFAARAGARVIILERNAECGKKILMSGGSRANVLPAASRTKGDYFTSADGASQRSLARLLATWPLADVHAWLQAEVGIPLRLEEDSQKWFPEVNSGRAVRDALLAAAVRAGATVLHKHSVERVAPLPGGGWGVAVCGAAVDKTAHCVVLATGGLSFPAVGTDGAGHAMAQQLGIASASFSLCSHFFYTKLIFLTFFF